MHQSGKAMICAALFACLALGACGSPETGPATAEPAAVLPGAVASADASASGTPAASAAETVDAAVQQRVKNLCTNDLQAQASGATPAPEQLRAAPKVTLVSIKYLGEIKKITLPDSASAYELGIEFAYKIGHDDAKTATKFCRVNLTDSAVDWKWTASP
ncbi:hypothetical protein AB4089_09730 [Arthrobacter sp. 2MCAF15]|uniref:hypothetical protein n=1 Tax=Arthrobacter sp. 2MCAF15 TaxID=3232984 RepID=UPI003F91DCA3